MRNFLLLILLLFSANIFAQRQIQGKVLDENGDIVIGAGIQVKGSSESTITNLDGKFDLKVPNDATVIFSSLGYLAQEIEIGNQTNFEIILKAKDELICEIVVTGYQELDVNEAAGSFNTVDMNEFEKKIGSDLAATLEGLSSSLVVASDPSGGKKLTIRGISTLEGSSEPLIIVDGFPYSGDLNSINSYDIESISLLKDAASASIYGAKSANGVIVIATKRGGADNFQVHYNNNFQIKEEPDIDYLMNRVSSSEMVDIETAYFESRKNFLRSYQDYYESGSPYASYHVDNRSKTLQLLIAHNEGRITEQALNSQLAILRKTDNKKDLNKLLIQRPFYSEHNLSVNYGTEKMKLRSSLNYYGDKSGFKGTNKEGVRYSLNSLLDISKRFRLDLLAKFSIGRSKRNKENPLSFLNLSPYERIYDDNGNPLSVTKPSLHLGTNNGGEFGGKDQYEIERLKNLGLLDETYYPASDYGLSRSELKNWTSHFQAQMRLNIFEGLDAVTGFSISKGANVSKNITDKNSSEMKGLINNLTTISDEQKKGNLLIPLGSRILETRGETTDYLLRGQLEYDKTFGAHKFVALVGSEIQSRKITSTMVDRVGYDERSNTFKPVDYYALSKDLNGVFMPENAIAGGVHFANDFEEIENRYFSFYSNGNYILLQKYILSGSVRIDQSNLFGTDPEYRFKPFWSVGAKWRIAEESFWGNTTFSKLDLQLSYGINGNVSNNYGPYDMAQHTFVELVNYADALLITSYSVPDLRWEKTATFNVGLHSSMFNDRLSIAFDYYRKNTKDVLADAESDPTLGSTYVKRNDATISNNGYELSFSTINIQSRTFKWATYLNLNYNESRVDKIYEKDESAYYTAGSVRNRKGHEPNSLYVFNWAGVDKKGNGQIKKGNGDIISVSPSIYEGGEFNPQDLQKEDLLHAGSIFPKLVCRFTNNFIYKGFSLSFMFVYQGGHVLLRDSYNGAPIGAYPGTANAEAAFAWKNPGDENNEKVVPLLSSAMYSGVIKSSSKNIVDGDFLRLRDVVLSYTIPKGAAQSIGIEELTVNIKGTNLFLWTKNEYDIDPEAHGLGYRYFPVPSTYSFGINVTF